MFRRLHRPWKEFNRLMNMCDLVHNALSLSARGERIPAQQLSQIRYNVRRFLFASCNFNPWVTRIYMCANDGVRYPSTDYSAKKSGRG